MDTVKLLRSDDVFHHHLVLTTLRAAHFYAAIGYQANVQFNSRYARRKRLRLPQI